MGYNLINQTDPRGQMIFNDRKFNLMLENNISNFALLNIKIEVRIKILKKKLNLKIN